MPPNPIIGVGFHWLGGLASASFYVPYKKIKLWSWEVLWLAGGLFSWLLLPWAFALLRTEDLISVLGQTPTETLFWCWFWGSMWGMGGLTFGLTMRYLGISLGMAVALGLTTVIGTLGPPIYSGEIGEIIRTSSGQVTFVGIAAALIGIIVVALAGRYKEEEINKDGTRQETDDEFDLKKGLLIAVFSGIMSGAFAWGLAAGEPIRELTLQAGTATLSQGLPVLCVVLLGGLTTNLIWCGALIIKNKTYGEFIGQIQPSADGETETQKAPLLLNWSFAALGGALWYFQFFFYTMGESQMGEYQFSSWTLHMASIILFATLWGFALGEWKSASTRTKLFVAAGIAWLVGSTVIIGVGNMLAS